MPFVALKKLRTLMADAQRAVYVVLVHYHEYDFFIAFCLLTEEDQRRAPEYALLRVRFMDADDLTRNLDCYVNSRSFLGDGIMTQIRHFLKVPYDPSGIDWFHNFVKFFVSIIPSELKPMDEDCNDAAIETVCAHEKRPNARTMRYSLILHTDSSQRSEYNFQLAQLKFPVLSNIFKNDKDVSFGFTDINVTPVERTEQEILRDFIKNHPEYGKITI